MQGQGQRKQELARALRLYLGDEVNVVAPLGTALTERQIELLWRLVETPVLCFDGDAAGQRAAMRAVVRALPLLRLRWRNIGTIDPCAVSSIAQIATRPSQRTLGPMSSPT